MNCRRFERDLADWIGGRLPEPLAKQMESHTAACGACSRLADGERSLRAAWRDLPALGEAPDLWPQLAARISAPREAKPARAAWLAWLPAPGPSLRYGLAGAAAAVVMAAIVMRHPATVNTGMPAPQGPTMVQSGPPPADENHVIQLVSDRQSVLPEAEGDLRIVGTARYRQAERFALGVTSAP